MTIAQLHKAQVADLTVGGDDLVDLVAIAAVQGLIAVLAGGEHVRQVLDGQLGVGGALEGDGLQGHVDGAHVQLLVHLGLLAQQGVGVDLDVDAAVGALLHCVGHGVQLLGDQMAVRKAEAQLHGDGVGAHRGRAGSLGTRAGVGGVAGTGVGTAGGQHHGGHHHGDQCTKFAFHVCSPFISTTLYFVKT